MGFETVFFAIVAFLVLGRLFQVLGQSHGAPPPVIKDFRSENGSEINAPINRSAQTPNDAPLSDSVEIEQDTRPSFNPIEDRFSGFSEEIKKIRAYEASFNPIGFESTAALAFEAIVTAFGKGDEATLKNLTDDKVFNAYQEGIKQRQAANKGAIDIVKLGDPKITKITIEKQNNHETASIDVEFIASLTGVSEKTRNTNEIWTFEKLLGDRNPVWHLCAVRSV